MKINQLKRQITLLHQVMLSAQKSRQSLNFATYKSRSTHTANFSNIHQGIKRNYTMDPQQTNPVYRHLRRQKVNKHILQFILSSDSKQAPRSLSKNRSYSPNFSVFNRNTRSVPSKQMLRFRSLGENILHRVNKISVEAKHSKRRISILDQYNNLMGKYCEVVPKLKTKNQKELFVAHQQIQKLCKEQLLFKEKAINGRIFKFRQFQEPKINFKLLMKNKRIASTQVPQSVQSNEQILMRNNTYSF